MDTLKNGATSVPLSRAATGIEGFDQITYGGLPRGRTTLVLGCSGAGKTVFALQSLVNGARLFDEPGIFVAFEEDPRRVMEFAAAFGWDLSSLGDKLFFLDARLSPDTHTSGSFDLHALLAGLRAKAEQMGARRIAFDSVDVLLALLNDSRAERAELIRLHEWITRMGLTVVFTGKSASPDHPTLQPYEFLQYLVDCVVLLQYRTTEMTSIREVRILKYRGSGFAERTFPFAIGAGGIQIAALVSIGTPGPVFTERVPSGIARLDTMLNGGYYRGSNTLITGSPGTAKTTLAGAFLDAACERGERACWICLDESGPEIIRNLSSVGIHLGPHVDAGLLRMHTIRDDAYGIVQHLLSILEVLQRQQARYVVIDPVSALLKTSGATETVKITEHLLRQLKQQGLTAVFTSVIEGPEGTAESSPLAISTLADTWIHLAYVVRAGERNRSLTIVKSRGTPHSNQVRELILSNDGITLADVSTVRGEVLMGTARWEKEQAEHDQQAARALEAVYKQREAELAEAEAQAHLLAAQRRLDAARAALARLDAEEVAQREEALERQRELARLRGADRGT